MKVLGFVALLTIGSVGARHLDIIDFVKCFIENERKPTHLVYNLCWNKNVEVKFINEMAKIGIRASSALARLSKYQDHAVLFLLDLDCCEATEVLSNATSTNLLGWPFRWLALTNSSMKVEPAITALWNSPLYADSDFVLAERTNDGLRMIELHRPATKGPMHSTIRGYYNGTLTDVREYRELFRRRKDVMGEVLTMANVIQDSNTSQHHLVNEDRLNPELDAIARVSWSVVKLSFEMLNATPSYFFSHRWGYKQDGQWSGMIGDLHSHRADVGSNCLVTAERLNVVIFTDRVAPFRVCFIFRQPPLSYVSNIFYLPFSSGVWIALFICAVISTATLCLTSRHEIVRSKKSANLLDGNVGDALLLTMCAVSQQGCFLEPKKASGRILLFILFTALMALYAAYSANIVVLLQAPSSSIRTLNQLAHSTLTLGAIDVDYSHFIFRLHKDPVRVDIFKKIDPEKGKKHFYDLEEGVEKIRQGLFAFHSIMNAVYRRIDKTFLDMEKCDLMEVDYFNSFDPFAPIRKDLPYVEHLRVVLKQIREAGIQAAISGRIEAARPQCVNKGANFSSVGLLDLKPVLLLMIYGVVLSVIIVIVEHIVFKLTHQRKHRSNLRFHN